MLFCANLVPHNSLWLIFFIVFFVHQQEQTLRPTQEILVNLEGVGLSLVNADKKLEIAYVGIRK